MSADGPILRRVEIRGFKALSDITLDLHGVTVLVGPNACGKSSVLQAATLAHDLLTGLDSGSVQVPEVESRLQQHRTKPDRPDLSIRLHLRGEQVVGLRTSDSPRRASGDPSVYALFGLRERPQDQRLDHRLEERAAEAVKALPAMRWLRLDAEKLASPSPASPQPVLTVDGFGLPSVLDALVRARDGRIERIEKHLTQVVPQVQRIRTDTLKLIQETTETLRVEDQVLSRPTRREVTGLTFSVQMRDIGWIPAEALSEGTLLALGLLTVLEMSERPTVLMLDDLDRALHPAAQLKIVSTLREVQARTPNLQILATAHAPMILAGFRDREIIRMGLDDAGHAQVYPHPGGAPGWMTPSEILDQYFDISRPSISQDLQRYALLADDPLRSDAEDAELPVLRARLRVADADPGWDPVERESTS
ncbi:MAG: AAA family ATPase [Alphaproteobacteria bacterium]|nr:AAA family ATPase [Alphaproteobacteria bacterium]